jgi:hypothetical protein
MTVVSEDRERTTTDSALAGGYFSDEENDQLAELMSPTTQYIKWARGAALSH